MPSLNVFERLAPEYQPRLVGVVDVDAGVVSVNTGPNELLALIARLHVTASGDGGAVPLADPNYHLAVADAIGRQSAWRFSAEPRGG